MGRGLTWPVDGITDCLREPVYAQVAVDGSDRASRRPRLVEADLREAGRVQERHATGRGRPTGVGAASVELCLAQDAEGLMQHMLVEDLPDVVPARAGKDHGGAAVRAEAAVRLWEMP